MVASPRERGGDGGRAAGEAVLPPRPSAPPPIGWIRGPIAAATIGVFVAAPWLDQRLVWAAWLGVAAGLLVAGRLRGWWGECLTLLAATVAIAIAFHWTPEALAGALATDPAVGFAIAAPIALWDALRLAAPFWFVARTGCRPLQAWLPAAVVAVVAEAMLPAVFPWKLGYAQVGWPVVVQSVDLLGPEFSTFVLFAHAGAVAWAIQAAAAVIGGSVATTLSPAQAWGGWLALAVCVANGLYGAAAMAAWRTTAAAAPTTTIALVQADPGDADGLDALRWHAARACADHGESSPAIVCWPECSGGCYADTLDSLADPAVVMELSRPPNPGLRPWEQPLRPLLFGGRVFSGHPEKPRALHQSAILVGTDQAILGTYRKRHLMPFGEYVPGDDWIPDLARWFAMQETFTPGTDPTVLSCGGPERIGVLLCYEDMLPAAAASLVDRSANVLVSLVNGSAFPRSVTLAQHRMLAQLRAIENRRALLRCSATGETCVVSPLGVVTAALPHHARGTLMATVPLLDAVTPARRVGPLLPIACGAAVAGLVARDVRRGWRRRPAAPLP